MGIYINLNIFPNRINAQEWRTCYEESVLFLQSDLIGAMGIQTEIIYSYERRFFSREIEHEITRPEKRFWNVVGDFKTKERAESFILHYDFSYYLAKNNTMMDVENVIASERGISVFSDKTQGYSYHIPILAVAMLIEDRFPDAAMVSGDIDIEQALAAQALLQQVLNKEIQLPIAVEAERLYRRLRQGFPTQEEIKYFYQEFRGDSDSFYQTLLAWTPQEVVRAWFMTQLKQYNSPTQLGAIGLVIEWLNATQDLQALCEMSCLDSAGPKYNPVELSSSLAGSWISIDLKLRLPKENMDSVAKQFLAVFMDTGGFKGRNNRIYIEESLVLSIFKRLFPEDFPKIEKKFKTRCEIERKKLLSRNTDSVMQHSDNDAPHAASLTTPPTEQKIIYAAAYLMRSARQKFTKEFTELQQLSIEQLKINTVRMALSQHLVFTEDAWKWIDVEQSHELLELVSIWLSIKSDELRLNQLRRALIESRELCSEALNLANTMDEAKILDYFN